MRIGNLIFEKEALLEFQNTFHNDFKKCFRAESYYLAYVFEGRTSFWRNRIFLKEAERIIRFFSKHHDYCISEIMAYVSVIQAMAHYLVAVIEEDENYHKPNLVEFLENSEESTYENALIWFYSKEVQTENS